MTDNAKFFIGIAFTALAQLAAFSYMQGGVNTSVKSLINDVAEMRDEIKGMTGKVYTIQSNSENNGLILRQVDGRVSKVEGTVSKVEGTVNLYGQRIAILEFAANGGN